MFTSHPKTKKRNSFTQPPTFIQICTYIIIATQLIFYFLFTFPYIHSLTLKYIFTAIYILTFLLLIFSTFICSYKDPSAQNIIQPNQINLQNKNSPILENNKQPPEITNTDYKYCVVCNILIKKFRSKHCNQCQRCVVEFDHHCIWINNCIGKRNYKYFIMMIMSVFIHLSMYVFSGLYTTLYLNRIEIQEINVIIWVMSLIILIFVGLDLALIIFHLYLNIKGITTYELLIINSERNLEQLGSKIKINLSK